MVLGWWGSERDGEVTYIVRTLWGLLYIGSRRYSGKVCGRLWQLGGFRRWG